MGRVVVLVLLSLLVLASAFSLDMVENSTTLVQNSTPDLTQAEPLETMPAKNTTGPAEQPAPDDSSILISGPAVATDDSTPADDTSAAESAVQTAAIQLPANRPVRLPQPVTASNSFNHITAADTTTLDATRRYLIDEKYRLEFRTANEDLFVMLLRTTDNRVITKKTFPYTADTLDIDYLLEGKQHHVTLTNLSRLHALGIQPDLADTELLRMQGYLLPSGEIPVIIEFDLARQNKSYLWAKRELLMLLETSRSPVRYDLPSISGVSAVITPEQAAMLQRAGFVRRVSLDRRVQLLLDDSVPQTEAPALWRRLDAQGHNLTGVDITIAVIDTGVDYTHPDLGGCLGEGCKVIDGHDFVNDLDDPMDDNGHGTHVAATAAGNGTFLGVAPDATIAAYKVLNAEGSGYTSDIIAALERVADPNNDGDYNDSYRIASMSLGGYGDENDPLTLAVDALVRKGTIVVAAAGNDGPFWGTVGSPASSPLAITVGASCKTEQLMNGSIIVDRYCKTPIAIFSSRGPTPLGRLKPDVVAPGHKICAARQGKAFAGYQCNDETHIAISGTSMATPHVSGIAALLLQEHPQWTPEQVKSALVTTTHTLNQSPYIEGSGEVNASAAADAEISISPATITPGIITFNTSLNITITNLANQTRNITLLATDATDETINHSIITLSDTTLTLAPNSSAQVEVRFGLTPAVQGQLHGFILVDDGVRTYRAPYGLLRLSTLNVSLDSDLEGADVIVHDIGLNKVYATFGSDREPSRAFNLPSGEYLVYAIGEAGGPFDYVLSEKVVLDVGEERNMPITLAGSRPLTVKGESPKGVPLLLYEWSMGVRTYSQEYWWDGAMGYTALSSAYGNRTVYVTPKPESNLTTDVIVMYHGVPSPPVDDNPGYFKSIVYWLSKLGVQ